MHILEILNNYIDENYKIFQQKICPTKYEILGIKVPILRKIAQKLIKENDLTTLLNYNYEKYYELILLEGLIIANIKIDYNQKLELIFTYLKKIDNWAICDIFCSELKFIKQNKTTFLKYLKKIKKIRKEYYQRFYIVILLQYYINDEYIDFILHEMLTIKSSKYYVNMAIAWCLSICLVKYYDQTLTYLNKNKTLLNPFVFHKTISKALDSYRLTNEQKLELKMLK